MAEQRPISLEEAYTLCKKYWGDMLFDYLVNVGDL
jgi:hypothetical protein